MSVSAWPVTMFALLPSGANLRHQIDSATTTPGRALSVTRAVRTKDPRSLNTRTGSPVAMPRRLASSGWMSSQGVFSWSRNTGRLAKVEFSALRAGGEIIANGYLRANSGLLATDSRGGAYVGNRFKPLPRHR